MKHFFFFFIAFDFAFRYFFLGRLILMTIVWFCLTEFWKMIRLLVMTISPWNWSKIIIPIHIEISSPTQTSQVGQIISPMIPPDLNLLLNHIVLIETILFLHKDILISDWCVILELSISGWSQIFGGHLDSPLQSVFPQQFLRATLLQHLSRAAAHHFQGKNVVSLAFFSSLSYFLNIIFPFFSIKSALFHCI